MATSNRSEVINLFERFYESAYRDAVENLVDNYPEEQRSLWVD